VKSRVAPIYTQAEAAAMIAEPKYIAVDAWNLRWDGRSPVIHELDTRIRAYTRK
jgi:hypothetical protein